MKHISWWHTGLKQAPKSFGTLLLLILMVSGTPAFARGGGQAPVPANLENPLALTLLVIIGILLLAILLLANVVYGGMDIYRDKMNKQKQVLKIMIPVIILLLSNSFPVYADQAEAIAATPVSLSQTTLIFLVGVIAIELAVIFGLIYSLRVLLGLEWTIKKSPARVKPAKPALKFWERFNRLKPIEEEHQIEMDHDYDGIKELDNKLPPWWLYGFYASILFAILYMWRFEVAHTGPSPVDEYKASLKVAEIQKTAYLATAANNIDETSVVILTGKQEIESGNSIFQASCAPCHGKAAEGVVGPNLTDDYWIHGGNIKDIFKTIKYGVPDKGMRSWKDEFSPKQLAQLSSYIRTVRGSNPPNAKPQQGDLFVEVDEPRAAQDSSVLKKAL